MLDNETNERMCRVGRQTPMGSALRKYWTPVAASHDLVADGEPIIADALGEKLVAFRNSEGTAGVVAEACCHRGASLLLGRVENCGLRCIYHGWLFAPDGSVLETPNVADERFRTRIRQRAFPCREAGGLVWAYLGDPGSEPAFPQMGFMQVPDTHRFAVRHVNGANFIQVQEALVDSTHLGFLHQSSLEKLQQSDGADSSLRQGTVMLDDKAPRFEAEVTEFGFRYAALRSVPDGSGGMREVVRVTPWIAPYTFLNPSGTIVTICVPMTDDQTAFYHVFFNQTVPLAQSPHRQECIAFAGLEEEQLASYGLLAQRMPAAGGPTRSNRWLQDRGAIRDGDSFSGFHGVIVDDAAVAMSAGRLRSREVEYLSHSDVGIIQLYRGMIEIANAGERDARPTGVDCGAKLKQVQGFQADLAPGDDWKAATAPGG